MLQKAIVLALLFVAVASPATYKLTSSVLGRWIASSAGCATQAGALVHAAVFVAVVLAIGALLKGRTETYKQPGTQWGLTVCSDGTLRKDCMSGSYSILKAMNHTFKSKKDGKYYQMFYNFSTKKYMWLGPEQQSLMYSYGY
jgi:hypothetical protein